MATSTTTELKEKYDALYEYMAASGKVENMQTFGKVMSHLMHDVIDNHPESAKEYIERLCAMKWDNYLTDKEAETITAKMRPSPLWSRSTWNEAMSKMDWPTSVEPHYNANALYVTMSMITSDDGETLTKYAGINTNEKMLEVVYHLALDKLKDADKVFSIRDYFSKIIDAV